MGSSIVISRRAVLVALSAARMVFGANTREPPATIEQRIFDGINFQRVAVGLAALDWDPVLCRTAREHSRRMLDAHFFGHQDPTYGDLAARLITAGVAWSRCAENVFRENGYTDPAAIAVVEWMYSSGHRNNLLTPEFRLTGVGVAVDQEGTFTATQQFVVSR